MTMVKNFANQTLIKEFLMMHGKDRFKGEERGSYSNILVKLHII